MSPQKSIADRRTHVMRAGAIAPLLYVSIFVIEGWLRPGYDSRAMYISALALGPRGWVQILNSVIFGLLLLVFACRVAAETSLRIGPVLLIVIAFGFLILGPFVMDPVNTPRNQISIHGWIHHFVARIVLFLAPVSCFAFIRFRPESKWRWCTLVAGMTVGFAAVLLAFATMVPSARDAFAPWEGLIQRAEVVPWMMWVFLLARTTPGF